MYICMYKYIITQTHTCAWKSIGKKHFFLSRFHTMYNLLSPFSKRSWTSISSHGMLTSTESEYFFYLGGSQRRSVSTHVERQTEARCDRRAAWKGGVWHFMGLEKEKMDFVRAQANYDPGAICGQLWFLTYPVKLVNILVLVVMS